MRRFDHREKLRTGEHLAGSPAREAGGGTRLTHERVVRITEERRAMLASLRSEISSELYGALDEKLCYEERLLSEAAGRDEQAADAHRRRQKDLPGEHFARKRIDANLI